MLNKTTQAPMEIRDHKQLTYDITMLMLRGAGYAAAVVVTLVLFIWVLALIGRALPEESRQQPDPTPLSWIAPFETTGAASA